MTIKFSIEEEKYIEVDRSLKFIIKDGVPDEIKDGLQEKVKKYNEWIDSLRKEKK